MSPPYALGTVCWMRITMSDEPVSRGKEVGAFLLLTAVVAPALTIAIVGGYGFVIWMIQIIAGPPGPPPG